MTGRKNESVAEEDAEADGEDHDVAVGGECLRGARWKARTQWCYSCLPA